MTRPLFSESAGHEFGTFFHHIGLVRHSLTPEVAKFLQDSIQNDHSWRESLSQEEVTRVAFEATSLFHEVRHLYDAFGTTAGVSIFAGHMKLLKEFCEEFYHLQSEDISWSLPLAQWAQNSLQPQPRRDFVRRGRAFHNGVSLFLAAFRPVAAEGHIEDLLAELDAVGGKVEAFPLRVMTHFQGATKPVTVFHPLGFETMMEGSAHAVVRNLVGHYFPEFVADELLMAIHAVDHDGDSSVVESRAADTTPPYMVADLLISRFLRSHGVEKFPRDIVLGLIDIVLSLSWLELVEVGPGITAAKFDGLGGLLVHALEQQSIDGLKKGVVKAPEAVDLGYKALLSALEEGGDWDTVTDDHSPLSSVMIWESYAAQNLTVPLIRARLETDHRAFRTQDGFVELLATMGAPPISVVDGRIGFSMPQRVIEAWGHVTMLEYVLHQMLEGRTNIDCARRFQTIPGIESLNYASKNSCADFVRTGCGRYEKGVFAPSPPCLFENVLHRCRLAR